MVAVRFVVYVDPTGVEQAQAARAVVLSANGAETPRLLLSSATNGHPDGRANSSGMVGRNLMFNGYTAVWADFPERLNEYKSVVATRVVLDFYNSDPRRGFYGGGIDARSSGSPVLWGIPDNPMTGRPTWGSAFKAQLARFPP